MTCIETFIWIYQLEFFPFKSPKQKVPLSAGETCKYKVQTTSYLENIHFIVHHETADRISYNPQATVDQYQWVLAIMQYLKCIIRVTYYPYPIACDRQARCNYANANACTYCAHFAALALHSSESFWSPQKASPRFRGHATPSARPFVYFLLQFCFSQFRACLLSFNFHF